MAEAEQLMFTLMFILGVGTFFMHHLSRLGVPYTVIMFVMGMLLGFTGYILPPEMQDYFDLLAEIPPRLLFHIFLPILIFEGAYGMKTHAFRQVFPQAALLAGPGLAINTIFVGGALKFLYPDWNWYTALLLGSILSATDPVAVVALLKDLGVDKRITALVDGEAIMNDGTAIIVFTMFVPAAAAGFIEETWTAILVQSLQLVLGGVSWGLFCGWFQVQCLKRSHNELVRTCVTISGAFMSFYIADVWLETSGVLTLCFEGVYLAANFPSMFPGKEGSMFNSAWHYLVHFANTIVFALVGIIIARDAAADFTMMDFWYIIFLYIVVVIGRLIMLYMMLPALNQFSYKLTKKELLLLVHGGLRGAVAATLSLLVVRDKQLPHETGIDFLVLTCGIVLLTITVNATTSEAVVAKLGLKLKESNRLTQMQFGLRHVIAAGERALRRVKSSKFVRSANWAAVEPLLDEISDPYAPMGEQHETEEVQFRLHLMRAFKTSLWRQRDEHHITEDMVRILTRVTADCLLHGQLISTVNLHREMQYPFSVSLLTRFGSCTSGIVNYLKTEQDRANYGVLQAYAEALDDVEATMMFYIRTKGQLQEAHEWLTRERGAIEEKIAAYVEEKPRTARSVVTAKAGEMMLSACEEAVHELHAHKGFSVPATEALEHMLHDVRHHIYHMPAEMASLSPEAVWKMSTLGTAPPTSIQEIARRSVSREFQQGEEIILHREQLEIAVVAVGAVGVLGRDDVTFGCGEVFGLPKNLTQRKLTSKFHALSQTTILVIPGATMTTIAEDSALLDEALWQAAGTDVAERLFSKRVQFKSWTFDNLRDMVEEGKVTRVKTDRYVYPAAANEFVVFLKGADASGLVTSETEPFILPSAVNLVWETGTVLYVVKIRAEQELTAARVQHAVSLSAEGDEEMTTPARPTEVPVRELSDLIVGTPFRQGPDGSAVYKYDPAKCVTSSPLFNALQLEFLLELEHLIRVADDYSRFGDNTSRRELARGIDTTLSFLSRFCLQHFSAEVHLYEQANLSGWAQHRAEHERFQKSVSDWMEKKYFDALCHKEIIAGMVSFVEEHFPVDHRDSFQARDFLPKAKPVEKLRLE